MATRKLETSEWRRFFGAVSKSLVGKRAEIEVASLDLGDQVEAEWLPLLGITYDSKNDLIEIALEGRDHLVEHPQEVIADLGPAGALASLEIVDRDGRQHIVRLREPLMLPPPQPAKSGGRGAR